MSASRDRILERLSAGSARKSSVEVLTTFAAENLWEGFGEQLNALGGRVIEREELEILIQRNPFVEGDVTLILESLNLAVPAPLDGDIWDVEVGFSVADFAIAETGSLVVSAGPRRRRMSSLVPPVNVMFVNREAIVAKLSDAIPLISSRSSAIVTGPSRTADIEGILVKGVHGPGELLVYVFD